MSKITKRVQVNDSNRFLNINLLKYLINIFGCAFLLLSVIIPPIDGLTSEGMKTVALLLFAIILWMTNIVDSSVSGLIVILLIPLLGIIPSKEVFEVFGSSLLWLLIGIMFISVAISKVGLDRRVAYYMIRKVGRDVNGILLSIVFTGVIFSLLIPMSLGRSVMQLPICNRILESLKFQRGSDFGKAVMLSVPLVSVFGSIAVITGSNGVVYSVSLYEELLGFRWDYISWFAAFFPVFIVGSLFVFILAKIVFPFENHSLSAVKTKINKEMFNMKVMTIDEKKLVVFILTLVCLWISGSFINLSIEYSTLFISTVLFLPKIGVLSWKESAREIDWGVMFIFAASLALARSLEESGVAFWVGVKISEYFVHLPIFVLVFIILLVSSILRFSFTTLLGFIVSVVPILFHVADQLNINPIWLGMVGICGGVLSILFPTQSPENLYALQWGYFKGIDMVKIGIPLTIAYSSLVVCVAMWYWPILGFNILN